MQLKETIPQDTEATHALSAWKQELKVLLLACDEDAETLSLLKNLSKSLLKEHAHVKIIVAEKIERENRWELFLTEQHAKLFIASAGFARFAEAKIFHTQDASQKCFFKKTPFILLSSPELYAKNPKEKILLWKQICRLLNTRVQTI